MGVPRFPLSLVSRTHVTIFPSRVAASVVALTSLVIGAATLAAEQRLADFRRVVTADDANAVQKATAEELAIYAGRIVRKQIAVVPWSKYSPTDEGLNFFVGPTVAEMVLGETLGPWKDEE